MNATKNACTCNACHADTCRCGAEARETSDRGCCCGAACGCGATCNCPPACGC